MQSQYVRMAIAAATVAIWMAAGWIFHLGGNAYLVLGIPYLLVFQLFVARRPVTELWLRDPSPRRWPWWTALVILAFMAFPACGLFASWAQFGWPERLWMLGAVVGSIPLGWAVVNMRALTLRCLRYCFLTAGVWGVTAFVGTSVLNHHGLHLKPGAGGDFASYMLLYPPVCFMMEEVFFRGGLDSFVQRPGDRYYWLSTVFVSVLWGWWHLPISGATGSGLVFLAIFYPLFHLPFGIWFSVSWRRGGSLLVPATVHAFVDSVRNAVM